MATWQTFIHGYAILLLKNILGWLLILGSFVAGPLVPGPGGIPMFLLGFALVTFPGKRRLTARVLRGRALLSTRGYRMAVWITTIVLPAVLVLVLGKRGPVEDWMERRDWDPDIARLVGFIGLVIVVYGLLRLAPVVINLLLRIMPRIRRKMRPALRRLGIHLLPPRWKRNPGTLRDRIRHAEEEILLFQESFKQRARVAWKKLRPMLPKLIGVVVVPLIFYRLLRPIFEHWTAIEPHLASIRWDLLLVAALMFAMNQGLVRLRSWRGVLKGLGWWMPVAPSARVWATSELARYVPGLVWQVVGRAFMARPYGLPMTTCSISQVLEVALYLVANIMVAVATLSFAGAVLSEDARQILLATWILLPLLLAFLHPRIFYPVVNFMLRRIGKPVIERQLSGKRLLGLLAWAIMGQMWLGLALWVGTHSILQVRLEDFWLLSGAYCLAWVAGFCLAAIAPSGIGVREFVLGATLYLVLPTEVRQTLTPQGALALFAAVALLVRLWATAGELIFVAFANVWDLRGARGHVSAPAESLDLPTHAEVG